MAPPTYAHDELRNIPSKIPLEQFDIGTFSREKIRDLFLAGKLPTAELMVEEILLRAVKSRATDLHVEPAEHELRIRLGHDGTLQKLVTLPREISENLSNVIKTKANMNAFEKKKPQEGRFSPQFGSFRVDIRVSSVPILTGERFAMRFLYQKTVTSSIEDLGFSVDNLEKFRELLHRSHGLIIITSLAGFGKSTTILAAMNHLRSQDKNIFTVEDPVEERLDFASQVALASDKGFSSVEALQAILRQDPDVIMVGEMRDAAMATVAAEAAVSGNLVLTSMVSNDALGTILRLLNLGVQPYWLSSSLIGIVHQQLVRKTCPHCKGEHEPTSQELATFSALLPRPAKFFKGTGCDKCEKTGYLGRTALHEVLVVKDELRDLIYQQASILKLRETAGAGGFENIMMDAAKKVANGTIAMAEFERVAG
jgi:type II secretory ATPase GspE/PulE/Tfp pilus assembly ATPase PilB-like protein